MSTLELDSYELSHSLLKGIMTMINEWII